MRLLTARPMLALATVVILAAEVANWIYRVAPPTGARARPWAVRVGGVLLALVGLALMRAACRRAARAERDYVINDLSRLHYQGRGVAGRPAAPHDETAELIATMRFLT